MNFAKQMTYLALSVTSISAFATDTINYGKANPPWKPNKTYNVVSRYEMDLRNIVLEVRLLQKRKGKEKEKERYVSAPFSGTYSCYLNYTTFATLFLNKNNGSTFRQYESANVEFRPIDEMGQTVLIDAKPGWFRRTFRMSPRSVDVANKEIGDKAESADFMFREVFETDKEIGDNTESADFMFREVFETDGKHLDDKSWYFLAWKGLESFEGDTRHYMDVFKRTMAQGSNRDAESRALSHAGSTDRSKIAMETSGDGTNAWDNWNRASDNDVGYNVAQAEAKMMSYAIYGQERTRSIGDIWTIDSETLESFFPIQSKKSKPFSFNGGLLVLTVEAIDANGVVFVKSIPTGNVDGSEISTDLKIEPITEDNVFKPEFTVDMRDLQNNYVRFSIDSRNEICLKAEMQVLLRDYRGDLPHMGQLSFYEKSKDRVMSAKIMEGEVCLHCLIKTDVEDME